MSQGYNPYRDRIGRFASGSAAPALTAPPPKAISVAERIGKQRATVYERFSTDSDLEAVEQHINLTGARARSHQRNVLTTITTTRTAPAFTWPRAGSRKIN